MSGKRAVFRFRWAFPIGQLLLCVVLLWPLRGELYSNLHPKTPAKPVGPLNIPTVPASPNVKPGQFTIIQVGSVPQDQRAERVKQVRLSVPSSLNFPAFFIDYSISGLVADKRRPNSEKFRKSWMAVTWPLLAIVFWWMAGRAVEALSAARKKLLVPRIGAPEVTVAIVLMFFGAGLSLSFLSGGSTRDLDSYLLAAGAALWALIGATMLVARIVQWRIRKSLQAVSNVNSTLEAGS